MSNRNILLYEAPSEETGELQNGKSDCDFGADIARLAALAPFEYDRVRKEESKRLGVQLRTLDDEVKQRRIAKTDSSSIVEELEPWPDPVSVTDLLSRIVEILNRFVILPVGADTAIPLWIICAFLYRPLRIFPKLLITSPEKRCGKTTEAGGH